MSEPNTVKESIEFLNSHMTSECGCEKCVNMCKHRVCWGTPEDIKKIIEHNPEFLSRLMIDWFCGSEGAGDTYLLCPASVGSEGGYSPFWPGGRCTFLTQYNKCEIHDIKPTEGKISSHDSKEDSYQIHRAVAITWESKDGYLLVEEFRQLMRSK